jgi:hypothetical protein
MLDCRFSQLLYPLTILRRNALPEHPLPPSAERGTAVGTAVRNVQTKPNGMLLLKREWK